ncbi:MAG: stage II sporulation protein M [Candidatus Woesearchaeota archaeon]|nr:stage II sporulation protein M [Candidatus Woesearchaeota archaeon]
MVFEQIYSVDFLKQHPWYGLLLGAGYSVFGMALAMFLFPKDPALVAVAITAILLLPSLYNFTSLEESAEKGSEFSLLKVWKENKTLLGLYLALFFGSFFVFAFFALVLPSLSANFLFKQQLEVLFGVGHAFSSSMFMDLLTNNFKVLMLCFLISLFAGNGSIFLIIWNASVWGTIFGTIAKTAAVSIGGSSAVVFVLILLSVLPHVFLEILSYILGVISGTVISEGLVKEKLLSKELHAVVISNITILIAGLVVLVIAVGVETFVLNNFTTYAKIARLAFP